MEVFVLAGSELKATVGFAGPIAAYDMESPVDLVNGMELVDRGSHKEMHYSEVVDFEHLNLGEPEMEDLSEDEAPEDETADQRRERRAKQRKQALEARQRRERQKVLQKNKVREDGEPFLKTVAVEKAGWYAFCVLSPGYALTVEMDMRKQSDMGGLTEDGHVRSYEAMIMAEEDKMLEEDTAAQEGIKEEDFLGTRDKLKALRRILADIQAKQQQERHRLMVHSAMNEHSHSRMVLSSLLETILFMVVTGFQVYTIRRWFKGAPVLGR